MQVSVETTQGLERRLTITVPAATVDAAVRKELNGLAKTRRIDGFRPGKAPVAIIKKMFGAMAHARVADEMMQNNFIKAIIESKLSPAGAPTMDPKEIQDYVSASKEQTLTHFILDIIPKSLMSSLTGDSILQVLFVSIMFGIGVSLTMPKSKPVLDFLNALSHPIFKIVEILMKLAPIGAFWAIAFTWMPCRATSRPAARVRPLVPARAAE